MKNKLITLSVIFILVFTSLISVDAAAASPRVDLNDYELTVTDTSNVYVNGTVNMAKGQNIALFDSTGKIPLSYTTVKNSSGKESFKIQVPPRLLKDGTNTFKVISLPVRGALNASSPKTFTVKLNSSKKSQTITAKDLSLQVNERKNVGATTNSGLPLTYKPENNKIVTIDAKGNAVGRIKGSTKVTITQPGNNEYSPASKTITITVTDKSSLPTQAITADFDKYHFDKINKSINLNAKAKASGALIYKSSNAKIVSVDSKGKLTSKGPGTAVITISQKNNATVKKVTVVVPKIQSRSTALQPWYDALTEQIKWQKNAKYNWSKWRKKGGDVAASKYYGTCITLPSAALQRLNILPKGGFVAGVTSKSNRRRSLNYMKKHPGYITNMDVNSSVKTLAKKNKIQKGDILHSKNHTWVYMGPANSKKTKFVFWECGNSRKNSNTAHKHTVKRNPTIKWVNRINCYNIYTSCKNGTITGSNLYMASQTIKITYKPIAGKKLKSVTVDNKKVDISKYPTSYTFKNLNKEHVVTVIFN